MKDKENNEYMESGFRNKEIGYKTILLYHLNNISTISATFPSTGSVDKGKYVFCKAVIVLDTLLSPYKDDDYLAEKAELDKREGKEIDKKGDDKNDFEYGTALLEIVMNLMARLGMLMEDTIRDRVSRNK